MNNMHGKKYWVWLSTIKNLGSIKIKILLEKFREPQKIWNLTKEELMKIEGIGKKTVDNVIESKDKEKLYNYIKRMNQLDIGIITIRDDDYPPILKNIYDPPIVLYYKGNKKILKDFGIAIIGCRDCSEYGKLVTNNFSYNLSKRNINIISGLARGIDSYSHIGALLGKGKTIAVVGNGLDIVYPKENIKLFNKIIELGGCVISEYPLGTKPEKLNFPARNRIISGMSNAIIVIEAKKESGTLITVDFALEQGKDVFVVPGNINSANSIGTNDLIKQGARVITSYEDIMKEYNIKI